MEKDLKEFAKLGFLSQLTKNINGLENSIARYIYNKYINIDNTTDDNTTDDNSYKIYLDKIFIKTRKFDIIPQETIILDDIKNLQLANNDYEQNKIIDIKKNGSLPDILRCSFICNSKNKYHRCNNKIMNDDIDVCYKHEYSENIYYDNYHQLFEK